MGDNRDSNRGGYSGQQGNARRSGQRKPAGRRPQFGDPEIADKLREIESDGEPMSLAEQISREKKRPLADIENAEARTADEINVTELQRMKLSDLQACAEAEGVLEPEELGKRELISEILKLRVKSKGLMFGEGTLQILPDGFGFLRSPEYHYLSCPDDIYVSPSQIRKFNLRNGAIVTGQIRPPKENERYFALLRVEKVNGVDPNDNARRVQFDELTPLHLDTRILTELK